MGDFNLHGLTAPGTTYEYFCKKLRLECLWTNVVLKWNMEYLMLVICIIVWIWRRSVVHQHQLAFPTVSILIPALINWEHVGALSISEPNGMYLIVDSYITVGSDPVGMRCKAERVFY